MTGMTRLVSQRRISASIRGSDPLRTSTKMSPSRWSSSSWTRCLPMNPVAPVTKYDMSGDYRRVTPRGSARHPVTEVSSERQLVAVEAALRTLNQRRCLYSDLPPPNMISSQLGTEARPFFLAGRRAAGVSVSGSGSGMASPSGSMSAAESRRG